MGRFFGVVFAFLAPLASASGQDAHEVVRVAIETELGTIEVELYPDQAPNTVSNFLRYVEGGFYRGGTFYRTVHDGNQPNDSIKISVIQGDIARARRGDRFEPIALERTSETGLTHLDGTLSMARAGVDSGTSYFFICVGDQPELDLGGRRNRDGQGFAAFGRVVSGMDVVRTINRSPAEGQNLIDPVQILGVRRVGS